MVTRATITVRHAQHSNAQNSVVITAQAQYSIAEAVLQNCVVITPPHTASETPLAVLRRTMASQPNSFSDVVVQQVRYTQQQLTSIEDAVQKCSDGVQRLQGTVENLQRDVAKLNLPAAITRSRSI